MSTHNICFCAEIRELLQEALIRQKMHKLIWGINVPFHGVAHLNGT